MSREEPRFGEVFEYRSDAGKVKVMYVGPPTGDDTSEFTGVCLAKTPKMLASVGEVADYISLIDAWEDQPGFGKWFEVSDATD